MFKNTDLLVPKEAGTAAPEAPKTVGLTRQGLDLNKFSVDDLLELRAEIDARLPVKQLKDVNMEKELVIQLQSVQRLQLEVMKDEETPANQKAQVAGQVANTLSVLGKLQIEIYSSERLKQIEAILIERLSILSTEDQEWFLAEYEKKLGAISA